MKQVINAFPGPIGPKSRESVAAGQKEAVNAFKRPSTAYASARCEVCLAEMRGGAHGQRKRFCSGECRRLAWALRTLLRAVREGKAPGLRDQIKRTFFEVVTGARSI